MTKTTVPTTDSNIDENKAVSGEFVSLEMDVMRARFPNMFRSRSVVFDSDPVPQPNTIPYVSDTEILTNTAKKADIPGVSYPDLPDSPEVQELRSIAEDPFMSRFEKQAALEKLGLLSLAQRALATPTPTLAPGAAPLGTPDGTPGTGFVDTAANPASSEPPADSSVSGK